MFCGVLEFGAPYMKFQQAIIDMLQTLVLKFGPFQNAMNELKSADRNKLQSLII